MLHYLKLGKRLVDNPYCGAERGAAAEAMRRILVERARRKKAAKHAGGLKKQSIDNVEIAMPARLVS